MYLTKWSGAEESVHYNGIQRHSHSIHAVVPCAECHPRLVPSGRSARMVAPAPLSDPEPHLGLADGQRRRTYAFLLWSYALRDHRRLHTDIIVRCR